MSLFFILFIFDIKPIFPYLFLNDSSDFFLMMEKFWCKFKITDGCISQIFCRWTYPHLTIWDLSIFFQNRSSTDHRIFAYLTIIINFYSPIYYRIFTNCWILYIRVWTNKWPVSYLGFLSITRIYLCQILNVTIVANKHFWFFISSFNYASKHYLWFVAYLHISNEQRIGCKKNVVSLWCLWMQFYFGQIWLIFLGRHIAITKLHSFVEKFYPSILVF